MDIRKLGFEIRMEQQIRSQFLLFDVSERCGRCCKQLAACIVPTVCIRKRRKVCYPSCGCPQWSLRALCAFSRTIGATDSRDISSLDQSNCIWEYVK